MACHCNRRPRPHKNSKASRVLLLLLNFHEVPHYEENLRLDLSTLSELMHDSQHGLSPILRLMKAGHGSETLSRPCSGGEVQWLGRKGHKPRECRA